MGNSIKELVNVFNLNNYFCDRINTNLTVEGKKIVGSFAHGTNVAEYLHRIGKEIIKQQYLDREVVAGRYYNLNCFPFVLSANTNKKYLDENVIAVELADSTNKEVIRNLKIHLVNELDRAVTLKLIARLVVKTGITEEEGHEWVRGTVKIGAFYGPNPLKKHYLYCIAFDGEYFEREGYDSETLELFKKMYIQELNLRLRECSLESFDFYHYKDDMLYIKNVSDKVVENVVKYVKGRIALSFKTPGEKYSKIENLKGILGGLISKWAGKFIDGYDYDIFTDEKEREGGNYFALIPLIKRHDGQLEPLNGDDVYEINAAVCKTLMSDIRGKTTRLSVTNCKSPVHAISNKKIAQVLPEIMQSPIAYNERTGYFEFTADFGSPKSDLEVITTSQYHGESVSCLGTPEVADIQLSSTLSQSSDYFSKSDSLQPASIIESSSRLLDSSSHYAPATLNLKSKNNSDNSSVWFSNESHNNIDKKYYTNESSSNLALPKKVSNKHLSSDDKGESLKPLFKQARVQQLLNQRSGQEAEKGKPCYNINSSGISGKSLRERYSEYSLSNDIPACRPMPHSNQKVPLFPSSSASDKNSDERSKAGYVKNRANSEPGSEFLKKHRVSSLCSKERESNSSTPLELQKFNTLNTDDKSFITKMLSPLKQKIPKIAITGVPRISLMLYRKHSQEFKPQELLSVRTPLSVLYKEITKSPKSKLDLPPGKIDLPKAKKHVQKQKEQSTWNIG
ncbi:hypothetical protein wOo_06340 [Wolbachia endosymbiont of Onchocerca ochengi]|uniref:hypothetical protein n=1 Tax=Wolbachia endosymbiont of Onchocerca ochengi TaxID=100901 RepID=UPI00026DA6F6|nr:hypothetical protein [Wolbachia endosymbiont of Onchocerca ochengi]CCF78245.1 hypothetical protein wOo_06340 [Wolbachia endosymbiont of Onchocerca ochengi]